MAAKRTVKIKFIKTNIFKSLKGCFQNVGKINKNEETPTIKNNDAGKTLNNCICPAAKNIRADRVLASITIDNETREKKFNKNS